MKKGRTGRWEGGIEEGRKDNAVKDKPRGRERLHGEGVCL